MFVYQELTDYDYFFLDPVTLSLICLILMSFFSCRMPRGPEEAFAQAKEGLEGPNKTI